MSTNICIEDDGGVRKGISDVLKDEGYNVLSSQDITRKLKMILVSLDGYEDHAIKMPDDKATHRALMAILSGHLLTSAKFLENSFLTYLVEMVAIEILEEVDKSGNPELAEELNQDHLQQACA